MFKIDSNINEFLITLPLRLKLRKNVREDIAEYIRKDIEDNLLSGTGIDGASVQPKKYGGRIFYDSGTLVGSVIKTLYPVTAIVSIAPVRSQIAEWLNNGTNRLPQRQFFGISNRVLMKIDGYLMNKKIEELFENRF